MKLIINLKKLIMETLTKDKKQYVKLGFSTEETAEIVEKLNLLLANYHVFYQKLRNFHWNVKGGDFFDLHEKFEELYTASFNDIDEIAERIRIFGQTPYSTMKIYLEKSDITEVGTDLTDEAMVQEVLQDIEILDSFMIDVINVGSEAGDVATVDMVNKMVKAIEKEHWMLKAFSTK
jgi:starvation-inducible DNA-binding protein